MAIRTVSSTGGNYNSTSTWVEGVVPTTADDVIFSGDSGNLVITSGAVAKSINFGSYSGTVTFDNTLTVSNNINLGLGNYIQSGTNGIIVTNTSTLTSNGVVWSRKFTFGGVNFITFTLADNWTFTDLVTFQTTGSATINSNTMYVSSINVDTIILGDSTLVFNGNGTWTNTSTSKYVRKNLTIDTTGTLYISGTVSHGGATLKYVKGDVVVTGSTLYCFNYSGTILDTSGMTWNTVYVGGTITLDSPLNVGGTFTNYSGINVNGSDINLYGDLLVNVNNITNADIYGTSTVFFKGGENQIWYGLGTTSALRNTLIIDKSGGTLNVSGTVCKESNSIIHLNGNVVTTGSTLFTTLNITLDTSGMTWNNVTMNGTSTVTLNSDFNVSGNLLTQTNPITINGLYNINVGGNLTLNSTTSGTANIVLNGVGDQTWSSTSYLSNNLTINKSSGNLTLNGSVYYQTNTLTYSGGTIITTGSTLNVGSSSKLVNFGTLNFNNVSLIGNGTITTDSDLNVNGNLITASILNSTFGTKTLYVDGNLTVNGSTSGSVGLLIKGSGTQTWSASAFLTNNLTINKSNGDFIVNGNVYYSTGMFIYNTGATTSVITTGSTLWINASTTFNTPTIKWNSVNLYGLTNITLINSDFELTNLYVNYNNTATNTTINFLTTGNTVSVSNQLYVGKLLDSASNPGNVQTTFNLPNNLIVNNLNVYVAKWGVYSGGLYYPTINNGTITVKNSFNSSQPSSIAWSVNGSAYGTTEIIMEGSSWSHGGGNSFTYYFPITFNNSGSTSINFTSNQKIFYYSGKLKNTGTGNILTTVPFYTISSILDLNTLDLGDLYVVGNTTLQSDLNITNLYTTSTAVVFSGTNNINVTGNLTIGTTTSGLSTPIYLNGSGNQTWSHSSSVYLYNDLIINKSTGSTLTIGSNVYYRNGTLTYTSGVVDTTTYLSTLNINSSCNLNTNPITWYDLNTSFSGTINLLSDLTWSNLWSVTTGAPAFSGLGSFTPTPTSKISFTNTSNVTTPGSITGYTFSDITMTSSNPTILTGDLSCSNLLTLGGVVNGSSGNTKNINVTGNLLISNTSSGSVNILINGSGDQTWTHSSSVYLSNNITINKLSGILTFGTNIYYGSGTFLNLNDNINVNGNGLFVNGSPILNIPQISWGSIYIGSSNVTLQNPINTYGILTIPQIASTININGGYDIFCDTMRFAFSTSAYFINNFSNSNIYTNNLLLEGASTGAAIAINNSKIYVNRNLTVTGGVGHSGHYFGTAEIIMVGAGTITTTSAITNKIIIDTSGTITFPTIFYFGSQNAVGSSGSSLIYNRGKVIAKNSTLSLQIAATSTYNLMNMDNIVWKSVFIRSGMNITMNEFFCGSSDTITQIRPTTTSNYTITFLDEKEKFTKFVNITRATTPIKNQLTVLTNKGNGGNNIGIKFYPNQLSNGLSKNNPSVIESIYGTSGLLEDPTLS
jgi:hypothetical protein